MSISLRAKPCAKNPAMNSETSPRRCRYAFALDRGGSLQCIRQHLHQRPQTHAVGCLLEQLLGAREDGQQVDDVLLGLVFDCHMLVRQRTLQCTVKVLAQARDGHHTIVRFRLLHDFVLSEIRGSHQSTLSVEHETR